MLVQNIHRVGMNGHPVRRWILSGFQRAHFEGWQRRHVSSMLIDVPSSASRALDKVRAASPVCPVRASRVDQVRLASPCFLSLSLSAYSALDGCVGPLIRCSSSSSSVGAGVQRYVALLESACRADEGMEANEEAWACRLLHAEHII